MTTSSPRKHALAAACIFALAAWSGSAAAQSMDSSSGASNAAATQSGGQPGMTTDAANARSSDAAQNAFGHVDKAVRVLHTMQADPGLKTALKRARGVFIVPDYGRVALGVGARGGAGVLLVQRNGAWVNPAFYTLGGISAGVQAGAEGGAIAMILNDQKALNSFRQDNNFSLNADAGLTVLAWSGKGQGSAGKGDITVWSDTKGLFGDLAISATDINFDEAETGAYYGRPIASAANVIDGRFANPHAASLKRSLAALPSATEPGMPATSSGSSGTAPEQDTHMH